MSTQGDILEDAQAVIDQARIVNGWADWEAHTLLLETGNQFRYGHTCLLTVLCDVLQMKLNSIAERDTTHTQDDVDALVKAVREHVSSQRSLGFALSPNDMAMETALTRFQKG